MRKTIKTNAIVWILILFIGSFWKVSADSKNISWKNVESLKSVYVDSGIFDHFGFASTLPEINDNAKAELLRRHTNTTTLGNEAKPQWLLWYYSGVPSHTAKFTASNGLTISVPDKLPTTTDKDHGLGGLATALKVCKDKGIQMRGHVLTWHSQTFDWFFCKDYDIKKGLVGKEEMTARQEWYIKTVMDFVAKWEKENNDGKHIIYTWDVVNEAVADDASETVYLRGSTPGTNTPVPLANGCNSKGDSRWYQIYNSDEFIINAFRFANKYAPKDVTLVYNDYNEYMDYGPKGATTHKRTGIINLLKEIKSHEKDATLPTRLDAFGMQSHLASWVTVSAIEYTIQEYLKLGIDLQVTELDFEYNDEVKNHNNYKNQSLGEIYEKLFKVYIKYAKSNRKEGNGITSVTMWCIEDEGNWLGKDKYPALFQKNDKKELVTKDAFFGVLNAPKK